MNHPIDDNHELQRALEAVVPESTVPVIEEEILIEIDSGERQRKSDEQLLSRFFGFCVIAVGVVTLMPAVYFGMVMAEAEAEIPLARWACIAAFLGGVHVLYGIYITQLVDYSAMQMLSVFLLVVTCFYGFTGMSLMLDDGSGRIANLLQIPFTLKQQAMTWCGIMFGVNALACYLFGREAMAWHRRSMARSKLETIEA